MSSKERSYELAVHAYRTDLYRYAFWLCRHQDRAEDLVQEALLRAWKYWGKLEDVRAVKAWLFSILRREHLRDLPKMRLLELETGNAEDVLLQLPDQSADVADELTMRQMLGQAPASLREALVLQVLGGFSSAEIAELLETSEGAVMTRLTRARQWLRAAFGPDKRDNREKCRA